MYDITVFPLEAVPVAKIQYNNFFQDRDIKIIKNITDWQPDGGIFNKSFISNTFNLFEEYNLQQLRERFNESVQLYVTKVLGANINFKICGSWVTKNTKGTFHRYHSHPNTVISVISYFDDDLPSDAALSGVMFWSAGLNNTFKNFALEIEDKIIERNVFNRKTHVIEPIKNTVIIFPGHIFHESLACNSNSRYCVGANYFFCDTFGSHKGKNYVEIR